MARSTTLLISSLLPFSYFYYLQYFLSPKGNFLFFQEQFFTCACIYHNKRSYSDMTCVCIHLYENTYVIKSISGRIDPKRAPLNYKVHKWMGPSQGIPPN